MPVKNQLIVIFTLLLLGSFQIPVQGQDGEEYDDPPPTLGLDKGAIKFTTPNFDVELVKASQTIAALKPNSRDGFDFTPADWLQRRDGDGYYKARYYI